MVTNATSCRLFLEPPLCIQTWADVSDSYLEFQVTFKCLVGISTLVAVFYSCRVFNVTFKWSKCTKQNGDSQRGDSETHTRGQRSKRREDRCCYNGCLRNRQRYIMVMMLAACVLLWIRCIDPNGWGEIISRPLYLLLVDLNTIILVDIL
jgi:hypothetical protein